MTPAMQFLFTRVFPALMILAGVAAGYFGVQNVQLAQQSESWPTADGTIEQSKVEFQRPDPRKSGTYAQRIRYAFTLDGRRYSGTRVAYGDYSSSDRSHAQGIVDKYPVGKQVRVYYLPGQPEECLLEPGVKPQVWFLPGFGAVLLIAGSLMFLLLPGIAARHAPDASSPEENAR